jgi:Ca2+-dependent lipid-binding protein
MIGDLASRTSDPYVVATLHTVHSDEDPDHCPPLRFRTHTITDTVDPEWECAWHVSNVPHGGSRMRVEVFDEDVGGHDDMLGHVNVDLSALEGWEIGREQVQAYKLRKRHADKKSVVLNFLTAGCAYRDGIGRDEKVLISVLVNGLTPKENTSGLLRPFTTGPSMWS